METGSKKIKGKKENKKQIIVKMFELCGKEMLLTNNSLVSI